MSRQVYHHTSPAVNIVTSSAAQGIKALGIWVVMRVDIEAVGGHVS